MATQVKEEQGKPFDGRAKVKMIATATAPYHSEGEEIITHPNLAHNVYKKNGWATFAEPEDEKDLANVDEDELAKPVKTSTEPGIMTTEGVKKPK